MDVTRNPCTSNRFHGDRTSFWALLDSAPWSQGLMKLISVTSGSSGQMGKQKSTWARVARMRWRGVAVDTTKDGGRSSECADVLGIVYWSWCPVDTSGASPTAGGMPKAKLVMRDDVVAAVRILISPGSLDVKQHPYCERRSQTTNYITREARYKQTGIKSTTYYTSKRWRQATAWRPEMSRCVCRTGTSNLRTRQKPDWRSIARSRISLANHSLWANKIENDSKCHRQSEL